MSYFITRWRNRSHHERLVGAISMSFKQCWPCIRRDSMSNVTVIHQLPMIAHGLSLDPQGELVAVKTKHWLGVCLVRLADITWTGEASLPFTLVVVWARELRKCTPRALQHSSIRSQDPRADKQLPTSLLILERCKAFLTSIRNKPQSTTEAEFSSQLHFVVLSVSLQAVSRPFELSLQSTLQLSLTVLVCYRYYHRI